VAPDEVGPRGTGADLRVARIDVFPVTVPRRGVFHLQRGASDAVSPFTVLKVTTEEGVVGYGESVTRTRSLHTVMGDHLAEVLKGVSAFDLVGLHRRIDEVETLVTERREHWSPLRAALDMAMYDIQGRYLGVPVHALLGGKQRDRIETVKNIGIASAREAADRALEFEAAGYRVLKMRVGADGRTDLERVAAVREAVSDEVRIRLDANEAWQSKEALSRIAELSRYGLEGVEQPCRYSDLRGLRQVVRACRVPVIVDESLWSLADAINIFGAEAADVAHLYLGKCGGIYPVMRIAAVADGFAKAVTVGERVPLGISEAAHVQVAAALPVAPYPHALSYDLNEHDLLVTPLRRDGADIIVPDAPGLGIDVDEDALEFYRMSGA
jgi:L-alanine-DL-glutamate epimerase-like enolase superfamily enzyme